MLICWDMKTPAERKFNDRLHNSIDRIYKCIDVSFFVIEAVYKCFDRVNEFNDRLHNSIDRVYKCIDASFFVIEAVYKCFDKVDFCVDC